jgi:transcription antitermination factor NusG
MPILPAEPDMFPADLLERAHRDGGSAGKWWALYTMARREKDLMRRLRKLEIPFYSPLVPKRNRSAAGRVRISHVPLFPGYVFLQGEDEQRQRAMTTNCVSQCLPVRDAADLVRDLTQVRRLIEADMPLLPEDHLEAGMRVRIRSGSLAGLEGVIIRRRGQDRLLVAVEFLQRGASVQLEDFDVERISH